MILKREQYKKYFFPTRLLISFLFMTVIAMISMPLLLYWLKSTDWVKNQLFGDNKIIACFVIIILAYIVEMKILLRIFEELCDVNPRKIYRGIGLYRFITFVSIISPILFIAIIYLMKTSDLAYSFADFTSLLLAAISPIFFTVKLKRSVTYCHCGLINSYTLENIESQDWGTEHRYHNEGGYYEDQKTTARITNPYDIFDREDVEITTKTYVPKQTVYDGLYQTEYISRTYKCCACGNIKCTGERSETRIG